MAGLHLADLRDCDKPMVATTTQSTRLDPFSYHDQQSSLQLLML